MNKDFIKLFLEYVKKDALLAFALLFAGYGMYSVQLDTVRNVIIGGLALFFSVCLIVFRSGQKAADQAKRNAKKNEK